jgi:NADH-quinone oxidoreductase subunit I
MYGIGLIKGLLVTLKNLLILDRMFTVHQYPDRKIGVLGLAKLSGKNLFSYVLKNPLMVVKAFVGLVTVQDRQEQFPRFRGEEFTWYEQRCTGCASCAKYCPLGIIRIVTDPSGEAMQEGQKYGIDVFDIDIGRCMFCGLCVEACPYDALHMGSGFEEGRYTRHELVFDIDRLKAAPKRPSTWFRPQLENKGYDPFSDGELDWNEVGRHERPTLNEQEDRWAKR